ncbi:PREDICTED: protein MICRORCHIDIA 7-like [Camelina sativa]|uniref:Protein MICRORCHIDIA 7-like n=1 Tax=Camelina sativa TaxID=90675 RepID=A0ABM0UZA9_CAMSA|nr:PREDICTED: protein MICRORCHIDIA 7-like [Camelina sativa]
MMDNNIEVKREIPPPSSTTTSPFGFPGSEPVPVVDLCSSDDDSDIGDIAGESNQVGRPDIRYNSGNFVGVKRARDTTFGAGDRNNVKKVTTLEELAVTLPEGFGQSNPPQVNVTHAIPANPCNVFRPMSPPPPSSGVSGRVGSCKQFWKAGDYEGAPGSTWDLSSGGFDHVRVHPKFLHSNATSHKWALGAFAELLDNALDEVASGATYVKVDMLENNKAGNRMLLIEDNGGGMDPEKMRQCMSLGYSAKSKIANTIGQYGNGFKTSTMRLGADVIVFSRCPGKDGKSSTQSIGLVSYTFLRSTGKEDIVVPMLDYERRDSEWSKIIRSSLSDWVKNLETIVEWSPFSSEEDLLHQFDLMKDRGTRIVIYNMWEDDQGMLELDFDADPLDIQLRGVNREEKNIKMAAQFPNSRHFLTYRHSLRSYVSILYLRIPPGFRIILRGKDVEHHSVVNDMMQTEQITYRPQSESYGVFTDMSAIVMIGFVKDAKHHVDVQGFNVYHKNRLIKPFWRIWNAAGSDGRGVIGVLEANFVEPAHDKQGFERTTVLSRLESRLLQMQKNYWRNNCHKIGYAPRHGKTSNGYYHRDSSPENYPEGFAQTRSKTSTPASDKFYSPNHKEDNGVYDGKDGGQLQEELRREKERRKALEVEVQLARQKIEEMNKEQANLIQIFSEERDRRDGEEEVLRNKLEEASNTIDDLLNKIKKLEGSRGPNWRH